MAKARTVLADDTPEIREFMRLILNRQEDFAVVAEAGDGADAVRQCEAQQPDLILLDLAMPVMDGLEAIIEIRRVSPRTKIVVLSGFEASRMANEALELGAAAYIPKGTHFADIIAKLRKVASRPAGEVAFPSQDHAETTAIDSPRQRREDDRLIPILTHELRNQVTVIEGFSTMMIHGWEVMPLDQKLNFVGRVARNATQMHALLDAFSDASEIRAEDLSLRLTLTDLGDLIIEVTDDLAILSTTHRVTISAPKGIKVDLDPVRIRQVLTNLLSNAAKFSPQGSGIHVSVAVKDGWAEVSISDEGPGIPTDRLDELFEPFSRLGREEKDGSGLGLYVSRGIARSHGGELVLKSSDRGACFVLRLPLP